MLLIYIIAIIIILILTLILFVPIHLILEYKENLKISVKIFSIKFTIYENLENQNSNFSNGDFQKNNKNSKVNLKDVLKKFLKVFQISKDIIKKIFKYIKINELNFNLKIGGNDASSVAIKYGNACAAVYPLLQYICYFNKPKNYRVLISPNFRSEKNSLFLKLEVSGKLFYLMFNIALYAKKLKNLLKQEGEKNE